MSPDPISIGTRVYVEAVQFSDAKGSKKFPASTGPTEPQRTIFGYTKREDYTDSQRHIWRPGTEFVTRIGAGKDSVAECWWTQPVAERITGTADPELYRYGVHAPEFWANLTVGPGKYSVRLCFAATRGIDTRRNCFDIFINGRRVVERLDVAATAGGPNRAADLVFTGIAPSHGIIEVRLKAAKSLDGELVRGEAF